MGARAAAAPCSAKNTKKQPEDISGGGGANEEMMKVEEEEEESRPHPPPLDACFSVAPAILGYAGPFVRCSSAVFGSSSQRSRRGGNIND